MNTDDPNIIHEAERRADMTGGANERIINRLIAELVKARRERDEAWRNYDERDEVPVTVTYPPPGG